MRFNILLVLLILLSLNAQAEIMPTINYVSEPNFEENVFSIEAIKGFKDSIEIRVNEFRPRKGIVTKFVKLFSGTAFSVYQIERLKSDGWKRLDIL